MPKIKMPKSTPSIDMTPMVDLAFLLVTFFMLISQFRPEEAVDVTIPNSVSDTKTPDKDLMTILVDKDNKVFFNLTGQEQRLKVLDKMGERYKIAFTDKQKKEFSNLGSFGVPMKDMPAYLNASSTVRKKITLESPGIPSDSLKCEICDWIALTRTNTKKYHYAIKGDQTTNYPVVKKMMKYIQDERIGNRQKFYLITNMDKGDK